MIAAVVQFTEIVMHRHSPRLYRVLGIYLPLITTNCAVLGVALLNVQARHSLVESIDLRLRRGGRVRPGAGAVLGHA